MAEYMVERHAVLQFRVVHPKRITNLKMKASVTTTIFTLREFIAAQGGQERENIKLVFRNELMSDHLTLQEHGIVDVAIISVLLEEPKKNTKHLKPVTDGKSTGSKRKRTDDDMSVNSKRTKVDNDCMSVSTAVTTRRETDSMSVAKESEPRKPKRDFWNKKCSIRKGTLVGGKSKNEDAVFSFQSEDGKVSAIGVFDGHGQSSFAAVSSRVSTKVAKTWFNMLAAEMPSWDVPTWKQNFDRLFAKMHEVVREQFVKMEMHARKKNRCPGSCPVLDERGVVRKANGFPIHGGTTVSISVVVRKENGEQYVVTAYVGDSDVIIAKKGKHISLEVATEGHRAHNRREFMRIKNLPDEEYPVKLDLVYDVNGVKDPRLLPKIYNSSGELNENVKRHPSMYGLYSSNVRSEPATYAITPTSIKADRARLANTRAVGDFYAEQFGLSHTPDISIQHLSPHESFYIIAGSDGVWDIMDYGDVVGWIQDVTDYGDLQEHHVAEYLEKTKRKSDKFFGVPSAVDDASLCIIHAPTSSFETSV